MPRQRTHPGEVLVEEYLKPLGLSARALGQAVGVPANRITDIIRQRRDVSADTAIRLGRFFDVDPRFWLNLQAAYDLSLAENKHDYSDVRPRTDPAQRQMDRDNKAEP
ncbi:MAG TPA: HigA family addiction module antitoxin [Roseiarcus sp.]|jgi:addiction module HigA family antidote